jgi:hypothetical protein
MTGRESCPILNQPQPQGATMKSAMPIILFFGLFVFFKIANWLNRPFKVEKKKELPVEAPQEQP